MVMVFMLPTMDLFMREISIKTKLKDRVISFRVPINMRDTSVTTNIMESALKDAINLDSMDNSMRVKSSKVP